VRGWKRPVLIVLATAPIGVALLSFAIMAKSELAFDDERCPFVERETREVGGAVIREEARSCEEDVEEHRWMLSRPGFATIELGRRRLAAHYYEGYSWTAREDESRVRIEITNPGLDMRAFREPGADAAR
jgi:hypothetical protein